MADENATPSHDAPITPSTKHQQGMAAIYAKADQFEAENAIEIDTSVDGFADAMQKRHALQMQQISEETGLQAPSADLSMVRGNEPGQPAAPGQPDQNASQRLGVSQNEPDPNDPFANGDLFYDENNVLCTTVTVNGREEVVPFSKARRGYQTASAANQKFIEASQLYRRVNEMASQRQQPASERLNQGESDAAGDDDIMDKILDKEAEVDELMLNGDAEQLRTARRELYELRQAMNPNAGTASRQAPAVPPQGADTRQGLTDDEVAANVWFATEYAAIQNNPELFQEAGQVLEQIQTERAEQGFPPLSPFDLVRECGTRMEHYLNQRGIDLDRYERTNRRRNADVTPQPASTAVRRRQPTLGAASQNIRTPEDEVSDALDYVRARKQLQEQFRSQGGMGMPYRKA